MSGFVHQEILSENTEMLTVLIGFTNTVYTVNNATPDTCQYWDLQVWEEMDQGGADQRETDGGSAHWNTLGVCYLHCFRQRQTNFL